MESYQYGDEKKSCEFLKAEVAECEADIAKKYQKMKNKRNANVVLGATGAIIFWPALFFMDLKGTEKVELEALQKRHKSLGRIAVDKECEWCQGRNFSQDYLTELMKKEEQKAKEAEKQTGNVVGK